MCYVYSACLWSDNAYACDPRIARFKSEEKERKLAEKRARQEAFKQKADEEEKVWILHVVYLLQLSSNINSTCVKYQCEWNYKVVLLNCTG